jgi:hypothetical protein
MHWQQLEAGLQPHAVHATVQSLLQNNNAAQQHSSQINVPDLSNNNRPVTGQMQLP